MLTARVVPRRGLVLRAVLASLEIMLGTVAAHTAAGGALPPPVWIAVIAALVLGGSLVVLRGRVPLTLAVPALAGAQLLLHCWLVALSPGHEMAGMEHGTHLELTTPMLVAHLVAALVTAAVWGARRRAVEVILAWSALARVVAPTLRSFGPTSVAATGSRRDLLAGAPRRGPPARLAPA